MVIKEVEGLVLYSTIDPEGYFSELHGHGVQIHTVNTVCKDIAPGSADVLFRRIIVTYADARKFLSKEVCCSNQKRSTTTGWVTYLDI